VVDSSGAAIVGAEILIANDASGLQYLTKTNAEGLYLVPNLPPGTYRLQVSEIGFKTIIKPGIVIHVQDAVAINFTLPIGAASVVVTVQGGAPLVNTESAAVSTVIDRQFVENLPLNGRSFNVLLQLTPGVVITSVPFGAVASPGQFSIAGQRPDANSFSVDGVSANFGVVATGNSGNSGTGSAQAFSALGSTSSLVSADALLEFRIETSSFAPEFGRSPGGQVILTTRSGTNDFHGGIFEYFRNDVLDANDWFANQAGKPRAPERHNDFGGVFGGPIWKNKTFFFLSYEGARLRVPQTQQKQVPSAFARTTAPSALAPFLNTYPQPDDRTVTPGIYSSTFTSSFPNRATLDAGSIRIDHSLNDRFAIFGRYNDAPSQFVSRPSGSISLQTAPTDTKTLTVGANMLFKPDFSNMVRANYSRQTAGNLFELDSFGGAVPLNPSLVLGSVSPSSSLAFFQMGGVSAPFGLGARNRATQVNFVDDVSLTTGRHELKFGADYRAIFLDTNPPHYTVSALVVSTQAFITGPSAGQTPFFSVGNNLPARVLAPSFSLYGQDSWKASHRLTLTYGLRWELAPAPSGRGTTALGAWSNTNNFSQLALAPAGTPLWQTTYSNFAPRVGAAYSLTSRGDFVVRAGFGLFYDSAAGAIGTLAGSFPLNASASFPPVSLPISDLSPFIPNISLQPPYPFSLGFANDLSLPRSYQWNVALEKSFGGTQAVSATYVGQAGRDLLRLEGILLPNSNFANFFSLEGNTAFSNYDALQLQYRRPLGKRLQALLNYTWAHSLDNVSDDTLQSASNTVISGARDYANSSFDVRDSFSGAATFLVPSAGKSGALPVLTRDWSLSTVLVARSGLPFNATVLGGGPGGISIRRPNLVSGQPVWISNPAAGGGKSLNPSAFMTPPSSQQGTEPRNDIPGFGLTQVDLSVARKFAITERLKLQFRTDAFNAFNHPNFTNPQGLTLGPSFFKSSQMLNGGLGGLNPLFQEGGPRSLQLSLRLDF
jgi:hypothetical protein